MELVTELGLILINGRKVILSSGERNM